MEDQGGKFCTLLLARNRVVLRAAWGLDCQVEVQCRTTFDARNKTAKKKKKKERKEAFLFFFF